MANQWGPQSAWTGEKLDRLKLLAGEGLSAGQIAAEFGGGLSRSAVVGACHRNGITLRGRRNGWSHGDTRRTAAQVAATSFKKSAAVPARFPRATAAPATRSNSNITPGVERVQTTDGQGSVVPLCIEIVDLEPHHCRAPAEDSGGKLGLMTYCGHPRWHDATSYCADCYARFYTPATGRTREGRGVTWKQF